MDDVERPMPEESASAADSAKTAAKDAANKLKDEAEATYGQLKQRGINGFFDFDHMYFPVIARYIFMVLVGLSFIGMVIGVIGGIASIFSVGIATGLGAMTFAVVGGIVGIILIRIWFELILLGFKIYEGIQEIRFNTRK